MKKAILIFSLCFIGLLIIPITTHAFSVKTGDSIYVAENETIEGNLYAGGNTITIDGQIKGDLFCGAQTININGKIDGDVICGAQILNINAEIGGSARIAGNNININSTVARGVQALGATITLGKDAAVGWDMFVAGASVEIHGKINGDLHGVASNINIAGNIGRDIKLRVNNQKNDGLAITQDAVIGGDVYYTARNEGHISPEAQILGEVGYSQFEKKSRRHLVWVYSFSFLLSIFSAFVIGLVLISLWRQQIIKITDQMLEKTGTVIGWGVVITFLTPIIAILLFFTLIGVPLAFLLLGVWLIALFVSKIFVGILIGRNLLEKFWENKKDSLIWAMIIGITLCWIIFSLPIIGWVLSLIALWWGLGGLWLSFKKS